MEFTLRKTGLPGQMMGYDRATLKDDLTLMATCSWSSGGVEQGHASASTNMKQHKESGENSLQIRSFALQVSQLIEPTADEKKLQRVQAKLARLEMPRPQYVTGRQAYFQALLPQASTRASPEGGFSRCANVDTAGMPGLRAASCSTSEKSRDGKTTRGAGRHQAHHQATQRNVGGGHNQCDLDMAKGGPGTALASRLEQ